MYLGSERFSLRTFFILWKRFFGVFRVSALGWIVSDIGKFIGIMGGRIQIAPTGMNVVIIDPMENIQIRKLGNVLNMR